MASHRFVPTSFTAGRVIHLAGTTYALGAQIPNTVVLGLKRASALLSRRWIIPSVNPDGSTANRDTPQPTAYGVTELRAVRRTPAAASLSPVTGPAAGGTAITITGTNLAQVASATVGGVAATSVVAVSETSVTAVTPAHAAGAVNVTVVAPAGWSTLVAAYTYTA